MTVKSLFGVLGISIAIVSAAEPAQSELNELSADIPNSCNTMMDVRQHINELQTEVYALVDSGQVAEAEELFSKIAECIPESEEFSQWDETLSLILHYINSNPSSAEGVT